MNIIKGQTRNFNDYKVFRSVEIYRARTFWDILLRRWPTRKVETELKGVVEADDATGRLVQQQATRHGELIFSNGIDDIILDNPCRLLLLLPNIRQAFHMSGYRPKLTVTYEEAIIIRYIGPQIVESTEIVVAETNPEVSA